MKQLFIFILLCSVGLGAAAQTKSTDKSNTIVEGYFTDERTDTIRCILFNEIMGTREAGGKIFETITNKGHFKLKIPVVNNIAYVHIRSSQIPSLFLFEYIIQKGDSTFIRINTSTPTGNNRFDSKGLLFSGQNCHSFEVRYLYDSTSVADSVHSIQQRVSVK